MSVFAATRQVDLLRPEPPVPDAQLIYDVFWLGDLPVGARPSRHAELPLGPGQLRAIMVDLMATQLAGRLTQLGAPLIAGSEGRPRSALRVFEAASLDDIPLRIDELAFAPPCDASSISLVICTRDRPEALARCLASLAHQRSAPGEIVVVDNSAFRSAEPACARFPNVRYLHEPRPGLSRARNAGINAARGEIVAFTDDDVEPHALWLSEIARAFQNHQADCITGLVLPASLESEAQRSFQLIMGGFGQSFVPLVFDRRFFAETRPFGAHVWRIGAGANMAFRRGAFVRAGVFDERLGAGASGCSEDSELWYRLLALGGICFYEPRVVVFHHHRASWDELTEQMRVYMRGHVSALIAQADAFGDRGNLRRIALQLPAYFLRTAAASLVRARWDRLAILVAEVRGWMAGLVYLWRPGWRRGRGEWPKL